MFIRVTTRKEQHECLVQNECKPEDDIKDLFSFFISSLNITSIIEPMEPKSSSNKTEWGTMLKMIIDNETDLLLNPAVCVGLDIDWRITNAFAFTQAAILSRYCRTSKATLDYLINSLNLEVWIGLIICLGCVSIMSLINERICARKSYIKTHAIFRLFHHLWLHIRNILQKPSDNLNTKDRLRSLDIMWIMSLLFLTFAYTGNLKSTYIVAEDCSVNSFEDALKNPEKIIFINQYSPVFFILQESDLKRNKEVLQQTYRTNGNLSKEGHTPINFIPMLFNEKGVFVDLLETIVTLLQDAKGHRVEMEERKLYIGQKFYFTTPMELIANLHIAPNILEMINSRIDRYLETAQNQLYTRSQKSTWEKYIYVENEQLYNDFEPGNLQGLTPIFNLMFTGFGVAIIILILELFYYFLTKLL